MEDFIGNHDFQQCILDKTIVISIFIGEFFIQFLSGIHTSAHPTCMLVRLIPQNHKISATSSFDLYGKKKRNCRPFVP